MPFESLLRGAVEAALADGVYDNSGNRATLGSSSGNSYSAAGCLLPGLPAIQQYSVHDASPLMQTSAASQIRKGKWSIEEEKYATLLISGFKSGLLPLTEGTTLRTFLSKVLNCDPMRISKKYSGDSCVGKQSFRPSPSLTRGSPAEQEQQDLLAKIATLESVYLARIAIDCGGGGLRSIQLKQQLHPQQDYESVPSIKRRKKSDNTDAESDGDGEAAAAAGTSNPLHPLPLVNGGYALSSSLGAAVTHPGSASFDSYDAMFQHSLAARKIASQPQHKEEHQQANASSSSSGNTSTSAAMWRPPMYNFSNVTQPPPGHGLPQMMHYAVPGGAGPSLPPGSANYLAALNSGLLAHGQLGSNPFGISGQYGLSFPFCASGSGLGTIFSGSFNDLLLPEELQRAALQPQLASSALPQPASALPAADGPSQPVEAPAPDAPRAQWMPYPQFAHLSDAPTDPRVDPSSARNWSRDEVAGVAAAGVAAAAPPPRVAAVIDETQTAEILRSISREMINSSSADASNPHQKPQTQTQAQILGAQTGEGALPPPPASGGNVYDFLSLVDGDASGEPHPPSSQQSSQQRNEQPLGQVGSNPSDGSDAGVPPGYGVNQQGMGSGDIAAYNLLLERETMRAYQNYQAVQRQIQLDQALYQRRVMQMQEYLAGRASTQGAGHQ